MRQQSRFIASAAGLTAGLLLTGSVMAQTTSFSGTLTTADGTVPAGAVVRVLNSPVTATTDATGHFQLALPPGTYQVAISAPGYSGIIRRVTVGGADTAPLAVSLQPLSQALDEAVVTATKQEEDLTQVPVAVTMIDRQRVTATRTWGLSSLTALVPNYLNQDLGVGFQQVQGIRGIQVFSENPAVATYIDGVNQLDILANGFALTDIDRIEVLRGPQGTLFGRNAMGGVINIITRQPTNRTEGFGEVSVGNLGLQRYAAGFKTPVVKDKLFFGLNGLYQSQQGYWKNDTTGTKATDGSVVGRRVGDEQNLYGNVYLKWLPSARFSATLNVKGQRDWSDATSFFVSQPNEVIVQQHPDKIYLTRIGKHDRRIVNSALTMSYFAPGVTLTSISAYQTIGVSYKDVDFPGIYSSMRDGAPGELLPPQQVYSQELRLQSARPEARLRYTVGAYGFRQEGYEPSTNFGFLAGPDTWILARNQAHNYGVAGFGEATYRVVDRLKVTAGLRYDYEHRESTFNGFGDRTRTGDQVTIVRPDTTVSGTYRAFSPKVALAFSFSERSSVYASYTRGFRAGGVNAQRLPVGISITFKPEYSDNYEVGYKLRSADGRLTLGAAAYLIRWKDLQFFNLVAPFTYARENVGDAQSIGAEVELTALPLRNLQVEATAGLTGAETTYRDFTLQRVNFMTGVVTTTAIGGNRLSNTPGHTGLLAVQYTPTLKPGLSGLLRAEVRSVGRFYTDIQNTLQQGAYTLLNTRAGLTWGKHSLAFWVLNLTNTRYLAYGTPDSSLGRSVRTAAPRTWGATLTVGF